MLSKAKHLASIESPRHTNKILRFAQDDNALLRMTPGSA
jgi:hypothetical protein